MRRVPTLPCCSAAASKVKPSQVQLGLTWAEQAISPGTPSANNLTRNQSSTQRLACSQHHLTSTSPPPPDIRSLFVHHHRSPFITHRAATFKYSYFHRSSFSFFSLNTKFCDRQQQHEMSSVRNAMLLHCLASALPSAVELGAWI